MAKKKKASGDYFGLSRGVSLVLAIFFLTSCICGAVTRFKEGKIVSALIRILLGWNIIWICDLVLMITQKRILRLLNV